MPRRNQQYPYSFIISLALIASFTYIIVFIVRKEQAPTTTTSIVPVSVPANLSNPFIPPLRDESVLVPINISTNIGAVDSPYRQVGILKDENVSSDTILLPLLGRPLITTRNKWQYYTMSDKFNTMRLSILINGRNAMNEYGCDELYDRDRVHVEGYDNRRFRVSLYENNTMKYLPFL